MRWIRATNLEHQPVLNVQEDLLRFTIISNKHMQCVTVLHPSQQSSIRGERDNREPLDIQPSLETVCIDRE